ncbi:hypothetical protein ACHAWF_015775 [Thalassiosira exigua]
MRLSLKNWLPAATALAASLLGAVRPALASEAVVSPTRPSSSSSGAAPAPPFVAGRVFVGGSVRDGGAALADVHGCCASAALSADDCPEGTAGEHRRLLSRINIGTMVQMTEEQALEALRSATEAWDGGSGTWPQMSLSERIVAIKKFMSELQPKREDIVNILMHEIGKNRLDAEAEFDRTMQFVEKTIDFIQKSDEFGAWDSSNGSTRLFLSRAAVGIVLCLGPYNYPLNETYATLIPALLMGNVAILKIPTVGGLAHLLTIDAFAKALPPGAINFISGSGRTTMPPLMASGKIDSLAFIGGSNAADKLIKAHPEPHRLKLFLQLEAKNMGVYLPDLFENGSSADMETAMKETVAGTLSYNGQRCTALKLLFVPKDHSEQFARALAKKVESMSVGLPWEKKDSKYSQITPLPNMGRIEYMKSLIEDAVEKGAKIVNKNGGMVVGTGTQGSESTLMIPAIVYPVTPDMKLYEEEQFGPVIPIAPYDDLDEVLRYSREGKYGQQVSIFTSSPDEASARLVDRFSTVFGKININSQCGRSPDSAPFSGRRSSAMGVMSVSNALREFSIPTVVSYKQVGNNEELVHGIKGQSKFLQTAW